MEQMKKSGYVTEAHAIEIAEKHGFVLVEKSEINANPKDTKDHPRGVWTLPPSLSLKEVDREKYVAIGESDRMTLLFKNPKKMHYRKLGSSGLKVSELSFGSWVTFHKQVDSKLAEQMFGICLDAGVNFFDNAEGYERGMSEIVMGDALKKIKQTRDSYCVSSKVFGAHDNPLPYPNGPK